MVGFALLHTRPGFALLGLLFLPFGTLLSISVLVIGLFKKLRFSLSEWLLLAGYLLCFSLLSVPYSTWERVDVTVCSSGPLGDHFLQVAAFKGDFDEVKKLVGQGHNVNRNSGDGETPLTSAIKGRKPEVVSFLLAKGADVNQHGRYNDETPLMHAAETGDTEVVKLLLEHGADPCVTRKYTDNESAQRIAEESHHSSAAEYLAAHSHCSFPPPLPKKCDNENAATCVEVH